MSMQGVQVRQGRARSRCLSRRPMARKGRPLPGAQCPAHSPRQSSPAQRRCCFRPESLASSI